MPDTFWDMSWDEYRLYAKGYRTRQEREWERTRLLVITIRNMMAKEPETPQQYMWLSTDEELEAEESATPTESMEDFLIRMQAANFYQRSPE